MHNVQGDAATVFVSSSACCLVQAFDFASITAAALAACLVAQPLSLLQLRMQACCLCMPARLRRPGVPLLLHLFHSLCKFLLYRCSSLLCASGLLLLQLSTSGPPHAAGNVW